MVNKKEFDSRIEKLFNVGHLLYNKEYQLALKYVNKAIANYH